MCIRDRIEAGKLQIEATVFDLGDLLRALQRSYATLAAACGCLLYTSDAADERSSVDLGGRRII